MPLIIYGASSALGSFAIKLAKASNIHPIVAICGASNGYVSTLLNDAKGDAIVDYRQGVEAMKESVRNVLGSLHATHALDCISASGTWIPLAEILDLGGQVSVFSGANAYNEPRIPENVVLKYTYVGAAHSGAYKPNMPKQPRDKALVESAPEFAFVFFRYVTRMLAHHKFEGHPYEVVPGGLDGVKVGLQKLKDGENQGKKFVYMIAETGSLM
jgi:NADPH2:quinone reductase